MPAVALAQENLGLLDLIALDRLRAQREHEEQPQQQKEAEEDDKRELPAKTDPTNLPENGPQYLAANYSTKDQTEV